MCDIKSLWWFALCWLLNPYWCCCWCPMTETETSSSYGAYLKKETESSLRKVVVLLKDRTMDNVQNCDSYIYARCWN
jgi:hypothetical protein